MKPTKYIIKPLEAVFIKAVDKTVDHVSAEKYQEALDYFRSDPKPKYIVKETKTPNMAFYLNLVDQKFNEDIHKLSSLFRLKLYEIRQLSVHINMSVHQKWSEPAHKQAMQENKHRLLWS